MKLFIAQALITDGMLHWTDDNDPVEVSQFLGAHDDLELAKATAQREANEIRETENEIIREDETGEAEMPELELTWTKGTRMWGLDKQRTEWRSDRVEYSNRDLVVTWVVWVDQLNPGA